MKEYLVQYTLPYTHIVTVGVTADSAEAACAQARAAFDSGDIWNNTSTMPLLQDYYEENAESDVLTFHAIESPRPLSEVQGDTMQLQVPEFRNDSIDIADETWMQEAS